MPISSYKLDFGFINYKIENQFRNNVSGVVKRLHRSKLQISIEILCSLSSNGPMKLTQINNKVELDKSRLLEYLSFLNDRGLIKEQNLGEDKKVYVVTERGLSVLKVIGPMVREAKRIQERNFEAISTALSDAKVTSEIIKEKRPKRKWKISKPKWKLSDFLKVEIVTNEED